MSVSQGSLTHVSGADERPRAAEEVRLEEERRKSAEQAERAKREHEQSRQATQKQLPNTGWIGALSASKFNPLRIASPTIRRSVGAGAVLLLVGIGSWLVLHYLSPAPQKPNTETAASEHSKPTTGGPENADTGTVPTVRSNANTSDTPSPNTAPPASEHRNPRKPSSPNPVAATIATEHWNARTSGTTNWLHSIFGTSDGKRLWAVGDKGTILEAAVP